MRVKVRSSRLSLSDAVVEYDDSWEKELLTDLAVSQDGVMARQAVTNWLKKGDVIHTNYGTWERVD